MIMNNKGIQLELFKDIRNGKEVYFTLKNNKKLEL